MSPMNDLERRIQERVDAFVSEITALVREAAIESVRDALGGKAVAAPRGRRAAAPAAGRRRGSSASDSRGRRSAADIDQAAQRILTFVSDHEGVRADEIARALGATTKELQLPMRKLVKQGELSTKGQKRATRYYLSRSRRR